MSKKIFLLGILILSACDLTLTSYSDDKIANYEQVELPLDTPDEAIEYSLSVQSVANILLNDSSPMADQEWNANAPIGGSGDEAFTSEIREKMEGPGYIVNWFKGAGCNQYGFQLKFSLDGTLLSKPESIRPSWSSCK